jgi:hypothetical protein
MQNGLHFHPDFRVCCQFIESEQVFFKVEVEITFKISESDWVSEAVALNLADVASALDENIPVEIVDDIVEFFIDYFLHVDLHLGLKIVESVQEGSDVTLQRPASVGFSKPVQ